MASIIKDEVSFENRHSKENHDYVLSQSKACADSVQEMALQTLKLHNLKIETEHAKQLADQAQAVLDLESQKAREATRLREVENAKKLIPKPPPRLPTPPPPPQPQPVPPVQRPAPIPTPPAQAAAQTVTPPPPAVQAQPPARPSIFPTQQAPPQPTPVPANPPTQQATQQAPTPFIVQPTPHTIAPIAPPVKVELPIPAATNPKIAPLRQIHLDCKRLRTYVKTKPKFFINEAGKLRRKMKMTLGQLVESGSNKKQTETLRQIFEESLAYQGEGAEGVDPTLFLVDNPTPVSGAKHNGDEMPLMFIYMMIMFSKAIVAQLVSEASAKPAAAEPIGVAAHQVFSQPEFQWRNCSFVDILIAKYLRACPILFGITANERTDPGRDMIGWKKEGGNYVSPQEHAERMVGLSAGYAALTLRNYGKTIRTNPYSPHHYWSAIATIVNTNPDKICPTQFIVLKALIENHVDKFISFYGDHALAALRVAVTSFPACAKEATNAVKSLQVLSDKWSNQSGFYIQ